MRVRMWLAVAMLVAVQTTDAQATAYDWPKSLSADTRTTLTRLADSARALGLPSDAIVAKASEGVLKGADDARIVRAVRVLVEELSTAKTALPQGTGATALHAAASALHAGVPVATLSKIISAGARNETELGIGLVAVADLAASGVPPADAGGAIVELIKRHAPEADVTALRIAVARDVAAGRTPGSALGSRMDVLLRSLESRRDR